MNFENLRIRNASSWSMFVFGILAFILGLIGLIQPEITLRLLNFEIIERSQRASDDYSLVFLVASSMASFNMGIYYILASLNNMKKFYSWTVPFRIVTFCVFTLVVIRGIAPTGFIGVGVWELAGALWTGIALFREQKQTELDSNT